MMAGVTGTYRAKYTAAGYKRQREENELYIASVPAGSAGDNLRDFNQPGYQGGTETPNPVFETNAHPAQKRRVTQKKQKRTFGQWAMHHAKNDKQGVIACVALCCLMLTMLAAWGGEIVEGVRLADEIEMYQLRTQEIVAQNEGLMQELEIASSGERIRNLAQNELGMLRPERANQQVIYIRAADRAADNEAQTASTEPRMEFLDIMLGLLDVFHIGE